MVLVRRRGRSPAPSAAASDEASGIVGPPCTAPLRRAAHGPDGSLVGAGSHAAGPGSPSSAIRRALDGRGRLGALQICGQLGVLGLHFCSRLLPLLQRDPSHCLVAHLPDGRGGLVRHHRLLELLLGLIILARVLLLLIRLFFELLAARGLPVAFNFLFIVLCLLFLFLLLLLLFGVFFLLGPSWTFRTFRVLCARGGNCRVAHQGASQEVRRGLPGPGLGRVERRRSNIGRVEGDAAAPGVGPDGQLQVVLVAVLRCAHSLGNDADVGGCLRDSLNVNVVLTGLEAVQQCHGVGPAKRIAGLLRRANADCTGLGLRGVLQGGGRLRSQDSRFDVHGRQGGALQTPQYGGRAGPADGLDVPGGPAGLRAWHLQEAAAAWPAARRRGAALAAG
mmetsp:Transcript_1279/g.4152  ORF Transcript_1279/g.4152 Transcript_1279/m.4152 type:complete len:392 (+) Transcript_1279:367-1542(+)